MRKTNYVSFVIYNAFFRFCLLYCVQPSSLDESFYYSSDRNDESSSDVKCEPLSIPFCQGMEYNMTIMPNTLGHRNQNEAALAVHQYFPAVKINCSPDIQFFVCLVYAPVCTDPGPLPPCKSLCVSVRNGCEKVVTQFKLAWPPDLDCNRFPDDVTGGIQLCVRKNDTIVPSVNEYSSGGVFDGSGPHRAGHFPEVGTAHGGATVSREFGFTCPDVYKVGKGYDDSFRVGNVVAKNCALPCDGMFFTPEERQFSRLWIGTWSVVCALSCLFTVLTFTLNTSRFRYPERPIIFLAICYLVISVVYVIGFLSGDGVACRPSELAVTSTSSAANRTKPFLIEQGTKNGFCTVMFTGLYFFSMASSLWWVILALTWFLAAGLKWGHEAIEANSQYFHLAAWAIPMVQTITIMAMGKIEGDVLTGVCFVGLWNMDMMRGFVLIPLTTYLVIGTIFLLFGFISLFRIRTAMKHDGTKTDKLEKLMLRIGIFSVLYTVPAVTVIVCLFYELINFDKWMTSWHAQICQLPSTLMRCPPNGPIRKPHFLIFMLKYLSSLIVGITSSVWIWSSKTVASWRELFLRLRGKRDRAFV